MTTQEREFVRLIGAYTANSFDVWVMAGGAKASCRAHCMSALRGRRIPQSQSGVNAMREALDAVAMADGSCEAIREDQRIAFCRQAMGLPTVKEEQEARQRAWEAKVAALDAMREADVA